FDRCGTLRGLRRHRGAAMVPAPALHRPAAPRGRHRPGLGPAPVGSASATERTSEASLPLDAPARRRDGPDGRPGRRTGGGGGCGRGAPAAAGPPGLVLRFGFERLLRPPDPPLLALRPRGPQPRLEGSARAGTGPERSPG